MMTKPKIEGVDKDFRGAVISVSFFVDNENGEQKHLGQIIMSDNEGYVKEMMPNICLWTVDSIRNKFKQAYFPDENEDRFILTTQNDDVKK
jgi:hypothetical protein